MGARTLDAYDGFLPELYKQAGFRIVDRMKWIDEFAPEGWDAVTYGKPDVVFLAYDPSSLDARVFTDWDKAKAYSREVSQPALLTEMTLPSEGLPIYRTENAHEAYKGKALWGDGRYFGTDKNQVADMTLDPHSEYVQVADLSKVDAHLLPANACILEINADELTSAGIRENSGETLRTKTFAAGYDGVHVITEDLNLGGDQIVLYRSLEEIQARGRSVISDDLSLLPKYARQSVELLTRTQAEEQLRKLRNGRPRDPTKKAAYARRVALIESYLRGSVR